MDPLASLGDWTSACVCSRTATTETVPGPYPRQKVRGIVCFICVFSWCLPTGYRLEATEIESDRRQIHIIVNKLVPKKANSVLRSLLKSDLLD